MAVTYVSAAYQNAVRPQLKGLEDEIGGNPARTHDAYDPYIGRILDPADACEVRAGICAPVAAKCDDSGLELSTHDVFPSTSLKQSSMRPP